MWWGVRKAVGSLVALRKESVDRNFPGTNIILSTTASLSARRVWIEIALIRRAVWAYYVALRKESVDRNDAVQIVIVKMNTSLSARRVWIEIGVDFAEDWLDASLSARRVWIEIALLEVIPLAETVALRKESVDRNTRNTLAYVS